MTHQERLTDAQAKRVTDTWLQMVQAHPVAAIPLGLANRLEEMVQGHMTYVYALAYKRGYGRARRRQGDPLPGARRAVTMLVLNGYLVLAVVSLAILVAFFVGRWVEFKWWIRIFEAADPGASIKVLKIAEMKLRGPCR